MSEDSTNPSNPNGRTHAVKKPSKIGEGFLTTLYGLFLYGVPQIISSFVFVFTAIILQTAFMVDQGWTDQAVGQFYFILVTEILVIVILVLLLRALRESWKTIGVTRPQFKALGYMLAALGGYFAVYVLLAVVASALLPIDIEQEQELGFDKNAVGLDLMLIFISLVILPPIVEEIIFRGFLYTRFRRVFSVWVSAFFVSILFAVGHLQIGTGNTPLWIAAIDTFVLSMVLVGLRELTGNIWAGVGVHALKNGLAFYLLFISKPV
jgi:membrane protease YdiL (CAAX protease family)